MKVKVTTMRTIFVDVDSPELEKECAMMESEEFSRQGYIEIPDEVHSKAISAVENAVGLKCADGDTTSETLQTEHIISILTMNSQPVYEW
jgi:hypothetical protein